MSKLLNGSHKNIQNGINGNSDTGIEVFINEKVFKVNPSDVPIYTTLNTFIRTHAKLPGTKFMCSEGGCGACIVNAFGQHPITKEYKSWAINSCLTLLYACNGLHITTIEGVGNKKNGYDAVQKRLADFHGTQCGYCSPGIVMNMYSLLQAKGGKVTMEDVENSFGGNICRCTGYRPILDAFKSLAIDADPKYKVMCQNMGSDIEELPKICPTTGKNCTSNCSKESTKQTKTDGLRLVFEDGKEWHKVMNLKELFLLFKHIDQQRYMLVAGNTAHGVYRRDQHIEVFIDINGIEVLHEHHITSTKLILGGNLSLTETMSILNNVATTKVGFEYFNELRKHIDLIANVPVRNAGTLAGNLSIKHAHNEFPSDLFLLLAAVGAEIVIAKDYQSLEALNFENYLKADMSKKIIHSIELKALDPTKYIFKSYKIMPRSQNAHAYVNAAFLVELTPKCIVNDCRICFGGINPKFLRPLLMETNLIGKDLYNADVLKQCITALENEIDPDYVLPDASREYRKQLAIALYYKFILETCPSGKLKPEFKSGGSILKRPISSGVQTFDTDKNKWPMTQPIQKVEGLVQCSGEAQYINDIPHQPEELWAAFVPATEVHATILNIDASKALKLQGVRNFISAKDIPGVNTFAPSNMMMMTYNEEILCEEKVKFYGQPLGIILADTLELANEAVKLVVVSYKKSDEPIYSTIKEVYDNNALDRFHSTPFKFEPSVVATESETTFKGHFELAGQYHFTMETQTAVCIPIEDGIELHSATQWVDLVQTAVSKCCNLPESSTNMQVRRIGGGYGAKISRSSQVACACAISTVITNRPVRFVMSLESNMEVIGKRFGLISDYEVSVDKDGKITKLINNFSEDEGCSMNEQPIFSTIEFFKNCYITDTWKTEAKLVQTDSPSNTWCRAPGTTEGIAMVENIMEHIARIAGLDPIDVRLANIADNNRIKELMPDFLKSVDFKQRKFYIENFNKENRWKKRGIAVVPMQYGQEFFGAIPVIVTIYHSDGTVAITHGGIECGQGINTKVVQVAAKALNVPLEYVKVKPSLNYVTPNSGVTGGSMTSEAVCYATLKACERLLERIQPVRDEMKEAKWHEITDACYNKMIELSVTHMFKSTDVQRYTTWGLSCAEIEVDILTGNFQLSRVDILEDTGESISPYVDVGQIEGAFVMGLGYWLTESLIYGKNGQLLSNRSWNYKPPGAKDIPIDFRINFLRNCPNPLSVLRSKATGEPALCMSIVAIFALRHAIDSARKDSGLTLDSWYNLGAPTTAEHVCLAAATTPKMLIL